MRLYNTAYKIYINSINNKQIIIMKINDTSIPIIKYMKDNGLIENFSISGNYIYVKLKVIYKNTARKFTDSKLNVSKITKLHRRDTMKRNHIVKLINEKGNMIKILFNSDIGLSDGKNLVKNFRGGIPIIKLY